MKALVNKKNNTSAILLAFDEDDLKAIKILFPITWGFHTIWIRNKESPIYPNKETLMGKVYEKYPEALAIGLLTSPEGFVDGDKKEISQPAQTEMKLGGSKDGLK